jgi:hypothetical protein
VRREATPAAFSCTGAAGGRAPCQNTAEGTNALFSLTTGFYNTAIGFEAVYSNTSAPYNTAVGANALYSNTDGFDMWPTAPTRWLTQTRSNPTIPPPQRGLVMRRSSGKHAIEQTRARGQVGSGVLCNGIQMSFAQNAFVASMAIERYVLKASDGAPLVKAEPLLNDYAQRSLRDRTMIRRIASRIKTAPAA